ncbi:9165_t:CDS:10 [Funneliformis mosseae]|uniref:9165_t:CDS:1 n=1 Tax=Funneliformis mosseae TaxID=27381 RepID=A0A9N8W5E0_FUNMO|nr:9165_t:CDS:10 [Funneliformis mosseae]
MIQQPPVEEEGFYLSWALLIQTSLLILSLCSSYYLQHKQIRAIHETVISIFAGMIVGLVIRMSPGGYEMKKENFFRNLGTILTFAFLGTFISAVVIGVLVGILSAIGVGSLSLSFLDSMIFGSVLSATDPVTVLTIFQALKVDPKLYSIIFGESILNDAVSIVLYELRINKTLKQYRGQEFHLTNISHGIFSFFLNFGASLIIGFYSHLHKYSSIESCIVALIAYSSYLLSNGLYLSGIVSLLFCGITLKHYAYDNMSIHTQRLTLFTQTDLDYRPSFIFFTSIIICISRYSAVFPLSNLINIMSRYRNKGESIPKKYSVMLFWAGLRGAVAFALAAGLDGKNANAMRTTILVVVVLSVIVFGGTTSRVLEIMKIQTDHNNGHSRTNSQGSNSGDTNNRYSDELQQTNFTPMQKHWFISFDDRFLKPFFTRNIDFRYRSPHNRWDYGERRHEGNNDDFIGLTGGSVRTASSRTPVRNGGRSFNNNNNSRIGLKQGNYNENLSEDSPLSTQQQDLDTTNPKTVGLQSFPDLEVEH